MLVPTHPCAFKAGEFTLLKNTEIYHGPTAFLRAMTVMITLGNVRHDCSTSDEPCREERSHTAGIVQDNANLHQSACQKTT